MGTGRVFMFLSNVYFQIGAVYLRRASIGGSWVKGRYSLRYSKMCFKFFFTFSRDMYILVYLLLLRCNSSSQVSAGIMIILNNEELTLQIQCQRWLSVQAAGRAAGRTSTTSCSHQTTDIVKTD